MQQRWVLSLEDVQRMATACRNYALREGWAVSIAIVDEAGSLLYFERMGARPTTVEVAQRKAQTALATRGPSAAFAERAKGNTNFLALGWMPMQGGMPLIYKSECVGAVGVSGVLAEQDELCARAACDALAQT
jgi:glc operon protein GlcG